jgi:Zn-dependent protease with chaperone function
VTGQCPRPGGGSDVAALAIGSGTKGPLCSLRSAAAAVLLTSPTTGCGPQFEAPRVNPTELEAARQVMAAAASASGGPRSAKDAALLLTAVSQRLAAAAQPLCTAYLSRSCELRVSLDPSETPRAAMIGQGQVTVTLGMMRQLDGEEEVAAVVGHEYGHHVAGHIERRRARGLAAGTAASTLLGAVVPFGGVAGWALGQGVAQLGAGAAQLAFSKAEEREADYLGAYLVARAGYDLDRAGLVWVRLTRGGPNETADWLDSHPAGPERLAAWRHTTEEVRGSSDLMPRRSGR